MSVNSKMTAIANAIRESTGITDLLSLDDMAVAISEGGSGSSAFMIIGGTTRPAKAAQNTIWLNTDVEITSYVLSASEPGTPVEGMAWVAIGNTGRIVATSPIGGNWITVYPLSAKQYVSGAWEYVEAKSYQNGEWVEWISQYLYKTGDECTSITGGWVLGHNLAGNYLEKYDTHMLLYGTATKATGSARTNNKVTLGNTVFFEIEVSDLDQSCYIGVTNDTYLLGESSFVASTEIKSDIGKTVVGVSTEAVASGYVGFIANMHSHIKIYRVWTQ